MRIWTKIMVSGIAAVAVVLLGAAGASGIDEMANARIGQQAPITAAAAADGQQPLRHLVLLGLAEGALPGGLPYDELRDENYEESDREATVRFDTATSGSRQAGPPASS
jgi:sulfite exporter TauE/SafE